ncbi:hypothetical protein FB561_2262 [Kribbella amoyensis]|uniref:DUF4245 family protein n=1 Tax=Kribbella amoyensis TaxID=996641 RepID=A0A561BQJ6_9ACTN|nr:hypothetical protein [Kribbella amoyensis]TWD81158.1 hypothetical protein FB561_2262 [Kribbella amoyensis]
MLTPRHQALVATLAGMTVGVAVFGSVLAINAMNSDSTTVVTSPGPSPTPTVSGGLDPNSLQFAAQTFGSERSPISADVPVGWKSSQGGTRPRYLDPTGVWQVRFDARGSKQQPDELAANRAKSIDERDLKVISNENGTLVYTYVDQTRGPRMGLSRWLPSEDGERTLIEITVGGRPQDEAALRSVLERATETLQLPDPNGDKRPN